jgi:outer membrane protein assembly factor BamB
VYCLNAETGVEIWNYTTGNSVYSSPAVVNGKVYIGSVDHMVYCLNAENGVKFWGYTAGQSILWSSPAVANGKIYIGSDKFYCLNAETGVEIWNYTTGSYIDSSPAVADGKVYFGSNDGKVYCLNAETGVNIWDYATGGDIESSPAVAYGNVYVGSSADKIYCFGRNQLVIEIGPITGGFGVSAAIKNNGTAAATNVSWWINVSGGIIVTRSHFSGKINELVVNGTQTIKSSGLWGIGSIVITVQVDDKHKDATGFLLGPLVLGVKQQ